LVEVAEILTSTARLIVNRASLKTAHAHVSQLIATMREVAGRAAAHGEPSKYKK
jgi:ATP phosphoribosyltransferase